MPYYVEYSEYFINKIKVITDDELSLIGNFISGFKQSGFKSLPGRNKPSTSVSENYVGRVKLIQFAIANRLWHYHVGFKFFEKRKKFGDWTSEYVVHYQKINDNCVRLIAYDSHPPFRMPRKETFL